MASTLPPSRGMTVRFRVASTLCHSVAFIVTAFRLIHRRRRKQFSWDDFWALVAVSCNNVVFIFFWLRAVNNDRALAGHPPTETAARINNYVMSHAFTCTVWTARISIACSVLRILPRGGTRSLVSVMTYIFGAITFLMLFFKSWICVRNMSWSTDCPLGEGYNVAKLTTDIFADVCLVAVPLYLLWHTSLPKGPRYMIRAVFATSILTTAISAMHAYYGMGPNRFLDGFTAHFESAVTVMMCNLLVVVTFLYRRLRDGRDLDDEVTEYLTTQRPRARAPITSMSFTVLSQTQFSTFLSSMRRGSSIFPEGYPSTNAARNNHPSFDSNLSSVGESTVSKAVQSGDALSKHTHVGGTGTPPLPPTAEP